MSMPRATSLPHLATMQGVASVWRTEKFWQMQRKSSVEHLVFFLTASSMQGRAQFGMSLHLCALTRAAKATRATVNFIVKIVAAGICVFGVAVIHRV